VAEPGIGLREVLGVAGLTVAIVIGAAIATSLLPKSLQEVVFKTPLLIMVLIGGTAVLLWGIARPRPPGE
jgi:apolipoprotein N-acyltransferase